MFIFFTMMSCGWNSHIGIEECVVRKERVYIKVSDIENAKEIKYKSCEKFENDPPNFVSSSGRNCKKSVKGCRLHAKDHDYDAKEPCSIILNVKGK